MASPQFLQRARLKGWRFKQGQWVAGTDAQDVVLALVRNPDPETVFTLIRRGVLTETTHYTTDAGYLVPNAVPRRVFIFAKDLTRQYRALPEDIEWIEDGGPA